MSGRTPDFYVAPSEAPPSRRPPVTTIGPLGWARANLFSSPANSIATVITLGLVAWFIAGFLSWAIRSAQWGVVTNNLRLIGSGLYDRREIWRVELATAILVLLTGLSLGIWGRVARAAFIAVLVTLGIILVVPSPQRTSPSPQSTPDRPRKAPSDFVFVGYKGDRCASPRPTDRSGGAG